MTILWPWRNGRLKWQHGLGGVVCSGDYRIELRTKGWAAEYFPHGFVFLLELYGSRSEAIRACELHALENN